MGWMFTEKPKGMSVLGFFEEEFQYDEAERGSQKIIDSHITLHEAYFAIRRERPGQEPVVFAVICLIRHVPRAKNGFTFGYKDLGEAMCGSLYYDCPDRLLDLLTLTDNQDALEWREKCRENNRKRKAKPKLVEGLVIRTSRELEFACFGSTDLFRVLQGGTSPRFVALREGGGEAYCRIRRSTLRHLDWTVAENHV